MSDHDDEQDDFDPEGFQESLNEMYAHMRGEIPLQMWRIPESLLRRNRAFTAPENE